MAKVFILKGKRAGTSVQLMGRYNFIDGVHLEENDDDAKLKMPNLCKFYGCDMMDYNDYVAARSKSTPAATAIAPASRAEASPMDSLLSNHKEEVAEE